MVIFATLLQNSALRCLFIFLFFFRFLTPVHAQPCSLKIEGVVRSEDGEWLSGAVVQLDQQKATTVNEKGFFILDKLCAGQHTLTVRFVGYKTFFSEIVLQADTFLHLVMEPEKTLLQEISVHDHFDNLPRTGSFQLLSGEQLIKNRGMALGEMLRYASGLNTLQTGPAVFKPVIDGLHSQRLLIINNGIRHESQQWGAEHAPEIDPFLAAQIVVIKDASALQYGPEALGGVLLVNPAPLPEEPGWGGEIQSTMQTNGRGGTVSVMTEGGSKQLRGFGWRAQASFKRLGDFHTPRYVLSNTGVREMNFSLSAGMHRDDRGWDMFFSHFRTELGILKGTSISSLEDLQQAMNREPPQYTTDFTFNIQNPRQRVQHNLLKLQGHRHIISGDLVVQYAFQHNSRQEFDLRRQSLNQLPAMDLNLLSQTLDVNWKQHGSGSMLYQFGINLLHQANSNVPGTQRIPFIPNFTQVGAGIYHGLEINLKRWLIDGSVRYDYRFYNVSGFDFANRRYTDSYGLGNFALSAGVKRHFSQFSYFSSHVGTTWRPPHVSELYSAGVHQSAASIEYGLLLSRTSPEIISFQQYNFSPERSWKWSFSWTHHQPRWQSEISAFINYINHFTFLKPEGVTRNIRGVYPYLRYTQTDGLFTGMDWHGQWNVHSSLFLSSRIALVRAEDRTSRDYLIYIPPNRYAFFITWKDRDNDKKFLFHAEVSVRFTDRQRRAPRVITIDEILQAYEQGNDPLQGSDRIFDFMPAPGAYTLAGLELGGSWRLNGKKIDLNLRADNLFNKAYRDYTNRLRYYALETGRNFTFSVRYSF